MRAGVREFKNDLSRYLERARQGDEVVVTVRGRPVARVVPIDASQGDRSASLSYHVCYYLDMAIRTKRSVSLPPDLAKEIDQAATSAGLSFSAWLVHAAQLELRVQQAREAVAEWEVENGPLTDAERTVGRQRAREILGRSPA